MCMCVRGLFFLRGKPNWSRADRGETDRQTETDRPTPGDYIPGESRVLYLEVGYNIIILCIPTLLYPSQDRTGQDKTCV